jgi:hypothetical protein
MPRKGRKIGRDWSYAPLGLIPFFPCKPSAHALGYILSRLRRWATAENGNYSDRLRVPGVTGSILFLQV